MAAVQLTSEQYWADETAYNASPLSPGQTVSYEYDPYGNITTVTDDLYGITTYDYNAEQQIIDMVFPVARADWKNRLD